MGSIVDFVNKLVTWVSDVINSVITWFNGYRDEIEDKNRRFLLNNEEKISNANNSKGVAKVAAEYNALKELRKIADEEQKRLDSKDQETLKDLFKDDPNFFNDLN